MRRSKMKWIRETLHQLVIVKGRKHFSQSASGQTFIQIDGKQYLSVQRGKHRGLPGRGMSVNRLLADDQHFELFSSPPSCLSYGSKQFTKAYIDELTKQRAGEINPYSNVCQLDNSLDI